MVRAFDPRANYIEWQDTPDFVKEKLKKYPVSSSSEVIDPTNGQIIGYIIQLTTARFEKMYELNKITEKV